jgi:lipopolysaccharide export system protein LptA
MILSRRAALSLFTAGAAVVAAPALAQQATSRSSRANTTNNPLGALGDNSKGPIRIDAAKLEIFDGEQRAVYTGDVVAVRGETVARTPQMTIFYEGRRGQGGQAQPQPRQTAGAGGVQDGAIKRIEFKGPVTVVSGSQTAKANQMIYDTTAREIVLIGNASIVDGENIQRGERIVYNTETRIATVTGGGPQGRVQTLITPGGGAPGTPQR